MNASELLDIVNLAQNLKKCNEPLKFFNLNEDEKLICSYLLEEFNIHGNWIQTNDREEFVVDNYLCEICELNNPVLICNFKTGL